MIFPVCSAAEGGCFPSRQVAAGRARGVALGLGRQRPPRRAVTRPGAGRRHRPHARGPAPLLPREPPPPPVSSTGTAPSTRAAIARASSSFRPRCGDWSPERGGVPRGGLQQSPVIAVVDAEGRAVISSRETAYRPASCAATCGRSCAGGPRLLLYTGAWARSHTKEVADARRARGDRGLEHGGCATATRIGGLCSRPWPMLSRFGASRCCPASRGPAGGSIRRRPHVAERVVIGDSCSRPARGGGSGAPS